MIQLGKGVETSQERVFDHTYGHKRKKEKKRVEFGDD